MSACPRACVIGNPIAHSRSPLIHGYWLNKYGISGSYERVKVTPNRLETFLDELRNGRWAGCNVTIPLKERAFELVDMSEEQTSRLKSVNTVYMADGKLCGISTDGAGFMASLHNTVPDWQSRSQKVTILGAGGAARALVAALVDAGVAGITIANRTVVRAEAISADYAGIVSGVAWDGIAGSLGDTDLLINSTSLGMTGQPPLDLPLKALKSHAVVADIVYAPLETDLLQRAAGLGHRCVDGLGMLLHQAVPGFEKWFGVKPEVTTELRDMVAADVLGQQAG